MRLNLIFVSRLCFTRGESTENSLIYTYVAVTSDTKNAWPDNQMYHAKKKLASLAV